ncbi:hypothetical protein HMI51_03575 [Corallococcus coralloides]|nr:hypothetical protein [Corallococcus coralloides]
MSGEPRTPRMSARFIAAVCALESKGLLERLYPQPVESEGVVMVDQTTGAAPLRDLLVESYPPPVKMPLGTLNRHERRKVRALKGRGG